MIRTLLSLLLLVFSLKFSLEAKCRLGMVAIFKNEAPYLREWIEFHRIVGIEHFWLYNNRSTDHFKQVLRPYLESGVVEVFDWDESPHGELIWNTIQCKCYMAAIKRCRGQADFVAFLDIDEFLFPVVEEDLVSFLKNFNSKKIGGIGVNWQLYGTSDVKKLLPDQLLIEHLTWKAREKYGENIQIKSIVRPEAVQGCTNPHCFIYRPGYIQVDSSKNPFIGSLSPSINVESIRINHYWTRDEDYLWSHKLKRREAWGEKEEGILKRANNLNAIEDRMIFRFLPKLKRRLGHL